MKTYVLIDYTGKEIASAALTDAELSKCNSQLAVCELPCRWVLASEMIELRASYVSRTRPNRPAIAVMAPALAD